MRNRTNALSTKHQRRGIKRLSLVAGMLVFSIGCSKNVTAGTSTLPEQTQSPSKYWHLPHTGTTNSQCYVAGSNTLKSCLLQAAKDLNPFQDGMRTHVNAMSYSTVGRYPLTSCVKDNVTGLVWEGKEASGLRAGSRGFTNYTSTKELQMQGDSFYVTPTQAQIDMANNSVGYKNYVNSVALCTFTDWRLPTLDELQTIVDYGAPVNGVASPAVQSAYFPNTNSGSLQTYWTDTSRNLVPLHAWGLSFSSGEAVTSERKTLQNVRLVRGGQ